MIFLNSLSSAVTLVFYLPGVCTHTETQGKQRKTRVRNILKSLEKTQYLMNTMYYWSCVHNILPFICLCVEFHYSSIIPFLNSSILPLFHSSILQFFHSKILQFFNYFILPFFHSSIVPFFRSSILPFFNSSILQFFNSSILQF